MNKVLLALEPPPFPGYASLGWRTPLHHDFNTILTFREAFNVHAKELLRGYTVLYERPKFAMGNRQTLKVEIEGEGWTSSIGTTIPYAVKREFSTLFFLYRANRELSPTELLNLDLQSKDT